MVSEKGMIPRLVGHLATDAAILGLETLDSHPTYAEIILASLGRSHGLDANG